MTTQNELVARALLRFRTAPFHVAVGHVRGVLAERVPAGELETFATLDHILEKCQARLDAIARIGAAIDEAYDIRKRDDDALSLRRIRELLGPEYLGGPLL